MPAEMVREAAWTRWQTWQLTQERQELVGRRVEERLSRRLEGTLEGDKGNGEKAKGGFHEVPQVGQVQGGNN